MKKAEILMSVEKEKEYTTYPLTCTFSIEMDIGFMCDSEKKREELASKVRGYLGELVCDAFEDLEMTIQNDHDAAYPNTSIDFRSVKKK